MIQTKRPWRRTPRSLARAAALAIGRKFFHADPCPRCGERVYYVCNGNCRMCAIGQNTIRRRERERLERKVAEHVASRPSTSDHRALPDILADDFM
jgi:hypothetical protein